jgi:hypothetical protein
MMTAVHFRDPNSHLNIHSENLRVLTIAQKIVFEPPAVFSNRAAEASD